MFNIKTMVVLDADVKNNYSSLEEIAMSTGINNAL